MINYNFYKTKAPEIVLNIPGSVYYNNTNKITFSFEIDYNSFTNEELQKIILNQQEEFDKKTCCKTFSSGVIYNNVYIKTSSDDDFIKVKTENNTLNFSMIKKKIDVLKNGTVISEGRINHSKQVDFSLSDGTYIFRCYIYNVNNELIKINDINVTLKTYYNELFNTKTPQNEITFDKDEGNFKIKIAANFKKLYSFKITDIVSENDNIFSFSYYNSNDSSQTIQGKIGSEIILLNDKQIEEIIKNHQQEQLIKPTFVFDIKEVFTTTHSKDDIGVVRFPTIREKIRDTYMPYYDLKCDVSQSYSVDFEKTNDLLVTDKFNKYPLFYKFIIDEPYDDFKIKDEDGNYIEDYIMETINKNLKLIYFNPLRNKKYYYSLDDNFYYNIEYKKAIDSYKMTFYTGKVELDKPQYISDLILYGPEGTYDVEIQFSDYNRKTFKMKSINREFNYLEDERVKINKEIISMKVLTNKNIEDFKFINVLCNLKNNRNSYSFFKKDNRDFVYIAKEVGNIKIEDIPNSQLSKLNINSKYILKDGILEEVNNGPIYLEVIKKQDIVFTDIEEWVNEYDIGETLTMKTNGVDDFFKENIIDNSMEIIDEIK